MSLRGANLASKQTSLIHCAHSELRSHSSCAKLARLLDIHKWLESRQALPQKHMNAQVDNGEVRERLRLSLLYMIKEANQRTPYCIG